MKRILDDQPQLPWRRGGRHTLIALLALFIAGATSGFAHGQPASTGTPERMQDHALVRAMPGFRNGYADVNGIRLHYVTGGKGTPLFLLPGWPQTWWHYRRIMPTLAARYQVVAVDLRGMGGSTKPMGGYDKKTMAVDIAQLAAQLGFRRINIAGHDIGSAVAFSLAANRPDVVIKLALLDVPHPDEFWTQMTLLPPHGSFGDKIDAQHPGYPWWFAFHQVKGLPEKLLQGRMDVYLDWMFDYLLRDPRSIGVEERAVYKAAYAGEEAIRAGNAWYQAFTQDAIDMKSYPKLAMPVLGLGSTGYEWLEASLPSKAIDVELVRVEDSGHYLAEEQPAFVAAELLRFFE